MRVKKNYNKMGLSLALMTPSEITSSDDCHKYGIISGCDEGCPALIDGKCKNINEVLKNTPLDEEIVIELKKIYSKLDKEVWGMNDHYIGHCYHFDKCRLLADIYVTKTGLLYDCKYHGINKLNCNKKDREMLLEGLIKVSN